ncbi:MAG: NUDIX domain-containing protein [Candidatus Bathyarchaeota archaeon]|nr:NUDIX domain-containing protein [Candidatus Bathyarchaeota archaeon]
MSSKTKPLQAIVGLTTMIHKLPEPLFKKIYSTVPRLCVEVIIHFSNGIVLVKRNIPPCENMWHIPGGTVLMGETLEEAVKRVAKEETNLTVEVKQQLCVKEYSKDVAFGQAISVVYIATAANGKLKGDKYGKDIKTFKILPEQTIEEQKELLEKAQTTSAKVLSN